MKKIELLNEIALASNGTKAESERFLSALVDVITKTIKKGDKVSIPSLGTFEKVKRSARQGVNPSNGQKVNIPAKNAPRFKASKVLKDKVN